MPTTRFLAGNPIIIEIYTRDTVNAHYRIYTGNNYSERVYDGSIYNYTNWTEKIDVSGLFAEMKNTAGVIRAKMVRVLDTMFEYSGSDTTQLFYFEVYGGGISKLLERKLLSASTNIFDWKLKNVNTNFFLTTRTNDYTINIPEDEIMPLYYYGKGLKFDVKVDDVVVLSKDHEADTQDSLKSIDFAVLRISLVSTLNKLVSNFRIVTTSGWSCTVLLTQATLSTDFYMKFKNSWGVYEKIALHGLKEYYPEFNEIIKVQNFDNVINDFVTKNERKILNNIYSAETGYKSAFERMFILDMLQSDNVILIANGNEYECNVSTDSKLLSTNKNEPVQIILKIELIDKENFISPILSETDYEILASTPTDLITTDEAKILV